MLFTGKGDKGTTTLFGCNQRISKSSAIAEALGTLDECNSFLGIGKVMSEKKNLRVGEDGVLFHELVHKIQQTLFIIQAELAGAPKTVEESKVREIEGIILKIEKELPPIKTFFISGGTELATLFDFSRTLARRAERRVVAVADEKTRPVGEWSLTYMNRISSILYALARLSNHKSGIKEESPNYK
jgi:cob(I)alamin adenosyltransferase